MMSDSPHVLPEITGTFITANLEEVLPGCCYVALPSVDPQKPSTLAKRIQEALSKGASQIITDPISRTEIPMASQVIVVKGLRKLVPEIAQAFYPKQPDFIAAITGTNGKTSVAEFTRQLWRQIGHRSASLGTLGLNARPIENLPSIPKGMTTVDPINLHRCLDGLANGGVTHLAMEASSHGLKQHRLDGLKLQAGVFTNLTPEHLDYHPTMEDYWNSKCRLFRDLLPKGAVAIWNADRAELAPLEELCIRKGHRIIRFGVNGTEIRILKKESTLEGFDLSLEIFGQVFETSLPLVGGYQVDNVMAALGVLLASGVTAHYAVSIFKSLHGVPGRLESISAPRGCKIFVDYAHSEDALNTVLENLRPHTTGRLLVVFGCGGDRDPFKRPKMARVAENLADMVFVTDDNPRSESPEMIRSQIMEGFTNPDAVQVIGDRRIAIQSAIRTLLPGDILVVAGKGHEQGQIIGDEVHPFDDAQVIRDFMARGEE